MKKLSARNQLKGKILEVKKGATYVACPNRYQQWDRHYIRNHERSRCRSQSQDRG